MHNGIHLDSVLGQVTDHRDRAFLLHLIRQIGHLDGEYCSSEKAIYQELHQKVMGNINLSQLEEDIIDSDYDHTKSISSNKKHSLLWRGLDYVFNLF